MLRSSPSSKTIEGKAFNHNMSVITAVTTDKSALEKLKCKADKRVDPRHLITSLYLPARGSRVPRPGALVRSRDEIVPSAARNCESIPNQGLLSVRVFTPQFFSRQLVVYLWVTGRLEKHLLPSHSSKSLHVCEIYFSTSNVSFRAHITRGGVHSALTCILHTGIRTLLF